MSDRVQTHTHTHTIRHNLSRTVAAVASWALFIPVVDTVDLGAESLMTFKLVFTHGFFFSGWYKGIFGRYVYLYV